MPNQHSALIVEDPMFSRVAKLGFLFSTTGDGLHEERAGQVRDGGGGDPGQDQGGHEGGWRKAMSSWLCLLIIAGCVVTKFDYIVVFVFVMLQYNNSYCDVSVVMSLL